MCLCPGHTKCVHVSYFNTFLFNCYIYLLSLKSLNWKHQLICFSVWITLVNFALEQVHNETFNQWSSKDIWAVGGLLHSSESTWWKKQHSLDNCWLWTCKASLPGTLCHFSLKYVFQSGTLTPHRRTFSSTGLYPPASSCRQNCIWVVVILCFIKGGNNSIYATFPCGDSR